MLSSLRNIVIALLLHFLLVQFSLLSPIDPGVYVVILAGIAAIEIIWHDGKPRFVVTEVVVRLRCRRDDERPSGPVGRA